MKLFTIGFTKTTAENFFNRLTDAGVRHLIDVRLNNVSQLAGFAKKDDLRFFVRRICNANYSHMPILAPTQKLLESYKKQGGNWLDYESAFLELMTKRQIESTLNQSDFDYSCLLCSEDTPQRCHRRLVAEYLKQHWKEVDIEHLSWVRRFSWVESSGG